MTKQDRMITTKEYLMKM